MKKLKFTIFKRGGGKISFGGSPTVRKDIGVLYRNAERKLKRFVGVGFDNKTAVLVNYGHGDRNESLPSSNLNYLLFCLVCFLEEYLNEEFAKERKKEFLKGNVDP